MKKLIPIAIVFLLTSQAYAFNYDKLGSKNIYVSNLQDFLIERNYLRIKQPTGYFGKLTERALKVYQRDRGLKVTGILDWETSDVYNKERVE